VTEPTGAWPTIMTIVGTRPEIIKLSRIIAELDAHTRHILVHTGQNYDPGLNDIFFSELGIRRPDHSLDAAQPTAAEAIAEIIRRSDKLFETVRPDAVLIYGDTNSGLAVIPAKRRRIPVFHLEAGNRCFDFRVPEEINRRILDHLSDVNLTHSEHARRYLLAEGLPADRIFKIGSPMTEVLAHHRHQIDSSDVLHRLSLSAKAYIIVSSHREETVDDPHRLQALLESLSSVATAFGKPVVVSTHPRTRKRLEGAALDPAVSFLQPFGFLDYVHLQKHAFCVISDSGTLTEEASILNFPAVMIRDAHERPEGMDEAAVIMASLRPERLITAVRTAAAHSECHPRPAALVPDYDVDQVSRKVLRIILSYIDPVRRSVWHDVT
jgi:UDP-N-acetylglucosamine 2-epimerase (non-hydrolysing)